MDNLILLSSDPVSIDNIGKVYHPTINDIKNIGLNQYYTYLYAICIRPKGIKSYDEMFDYICSINQYTELFKIASSFFLNEEVFYYEKYQSFAYGTNGCFINKDNFSNFVNVLREMNCVKKDSEENEEYASEKAKQIAEKIKQAKAKREKTKENEVILLDTIISSVAAKHPSYNLFNIWDLTIYQLYDQYARLNLIDQYEVNVGAMIQGAEVKNLKHWSSKLEIN